MAIPVQAIMAYRQAAAGLINQPFPGPQFSETANVRVLLTAFEPYEKWIENSSWLTLVELLRGRLDQVELVTRRYPVDLPVVRERLYNDLLQGFDAVLHLGQCPGSPDIRLEMLAVNFAGRIENEGQELGVVIEDGPLAYRSQLPLGQWVELLRQHSIPTSISYHAGTFLCNATMYLSLHYGRVLAKCPQVAFIHLPLTSQQVAAEGLSMPSLPVETLAQAIRILIGNLAESSNAGPAAKEVADLVMHPPESYEIPL
ncbi:MAG: pyroglutamyl-peptidase I [Pirellulaceae bacterium]|nr:pyroglutamyl-peptidase I [Pirellulaceae bacterium]